MASGPPQSTLPVQQDPESAIPDPAWEPEPEPAWGQEPEPAWGQAEPAPPEPGPEPEPGPGGPVPGTGRELVPVEDLPARRISTAEHLLLAFLGWYARTADSQRKHRSFWHWLWDGVWNGRPESLGQHRAHIKSRDWLEDYLTGWLRILVEWENVAFALLVARPVKAACILVSRMVERQPRFWVTVGLLILAAVIWKAANH